MIGALLADITPWLAIVGGAVIAFLGYGRHQKGQGRDEARQVARTVALEADKEASDVAQNATAAVDRADPDERDRLRDKWTRPD